MLFTDIWGRYGYYKIAVSSSIFKQGNGCTATKTNALKDMRD
jgi:hypothetical protein